MVGSHPKDVSPFGIYDMAGNAQEWTDDGIFYRELPPMKRTAGSDWAWSPRTALFPDRTLAGHPGGDVEGEWAGIRCASSL